MADPELGILKRQLSDLLKPENSIMLRTYYESLRTQMVGVRALWDGHYDQLRMFFSPRNFRTDPSQANDGQRMDFQIINERGTLALRTLKAGLQNGLSNQTKKWFKLAVQNREMMKNSEVKKWCEDVADVIRRCMLKSNYYQTLLECYGNEALYGTCAFLIMEDAKTDINCMTYPTGSYWLGVDNTLRVHLSLRTIQYTPLQMVNQFGDEAVSSSVLTQFFSNAGGNKEQSNYTVVHIIHPSNYFGPVSADTPAWMSVWYDISTFNDQNPQLRGLLKREYFHENPCITGRWDTIGENIYGESPAMDILGSTMSLQAYEERTAQATEKGFNPPLVVDPLCDPRRLSTLPGEYSFVPFKDGKPLIAPAYGIDFKIDGALQMIQRIEDRIREGLFQDVFQMFSTMDNKQPITAEEVRAKAQEKMQVLGPVVERNVEEMHAPSIQRILSILMRIPGRIPPAPQAMKSRDGKINVNLTLEFESILLSASRMGDINNIQTVLQIAGSEVAVAQGVMDNIDMDKTIQKVAELAGMPVECIRTPQQVMELRKQQAAQQQRQQLMENAQGLAAAANSAANTPTGDGTNLLQKVAPNLAGGTDQ